MVIPKLDTVADYLTLYNKNHHDREAFVFVHTDGSRTAITFGQLYENSLRLAKAFLALGVQYSEVIAIGLRSCPEWLYAMLGAILAGARPIGLSFTYTDGSDIIAVMKKLQNCSAIVLDPVADEETWKIFQKLVQECDDKGHVQSDEMPYLRYLICRQKASDKITMLTVEDMMKWEPKNALPEVQPDDIAVLFQTSGSTGSPKAVAHTNRSLVASAIMSSSSTPEGMFFSAYNDRPFNWMGGFPLNVLTGDTRVTRFGYCEEPKDLEEFTINVVKSENCVALGVLPPFLQSLIEWQNRTKSDWRVPCIACGGQPLSAAFYSSAGDLCHVLVSSYGATEFFVGSILFLADPKTFKDNCIGRPYGDTQMKICDDDGQTVPANERGEIYVKSEGMFQGYYNDPEKTKAVFTDDGWFKTDDIGYATEVGTFFCEGRKSEVIISGGMNVVPSILEAVIQKCPGVASVVCVPVAHEVMFQVVCACVIRGDGSDLTEAQLRQYCEKVHNDKSKVFTVLPTHYLFLLQFPETYTGKLSRKKLREMAAERFSFA